MSKLSSAQEETEHARLDMPVSGSSSNGSSQSSGRTDLEASWVSTPVKNQDLGNLNNFLVRGGFEPAIGQLKSSYDTAAPRTRRYYKQKAREGINLVLNCLSLGHEEAVWRYVQKADMETSTINALIACYESADSRKLNA
ncbi:uncharacterized protein LOC106158379 [Lingula anatina]|uniref:Uncharacterized protein LOC106158379 n=1 Tax=Lingula anatina TaxID=7574 RepID=A0A1S3HUS9_LINAN|nr:uncharacterized protein LOC106158379 [Lingula anatina]|eukprot:XP_013389773.1 uncharacterized protein LOC106158379 [Lingula anatina]